MGIILGILFIFALLAWFISLWAEVLGFGRKKRNR